MKKKIALVILSLIVLISSTSMAFADEITIGSKNFTENIILAHIMADVIEANTDLTVDRKVNLGGSNIAWQALQSNEIQLYPDYTGTIVANYYQSETGDSEQTYASAVELTAADGIAITQAFGLNNTYTLAVTQETAEKYSLKTFSDLAAISADLTLGCEFEFEDRADGYPGLQETYGMNYKDVVGMDHGIMYMSLAQGQVDVIDSYSTDGQLVVYNLVILEDDLSFFPPYNAVPVVRQDVLDNYPEIADALALLDGLIDDVTMQELNAQVDADGLKAEDVAMNFLVSVGIIEQ